MYVQFIRATFTPLSLPLLAINQPINHSQDHSTKKTPPIIIESMGPNADEQTNEAPVRLGQAIEYRKESAHNRSIGKG